MTDPSKIKTAHLQRAACVYIRQSTPGQVEHNRESTARQYALADRACQLGWSKQQVVVIAGDSVIVDMPAAEPQGCEKYKDQSVAHISCARAWLQMSTLRCTYAPSPQPIKYKG